MRVNGPLRSAQLERLGDQTSNTRIVGLIWLDSTTLEAKLDDGTTIQTILTADQAQEIQSKILNAPDIKAVTNPGNTGITGGAVRLWAKDGVLYYRRQVTGTNHFEDISLTTPGLKGEDRIGYNIVRRLDTSNSRPMAETDFILDQSGSRILVAYGDDSRDEAYLKSVIVHSKMGYIDDDGHQRLFDITANESPNVGVDEVKYHAFTVTLPPGFSFTATGTKPELVSGQGTLIFTWGKEGQRGMPAIGKVLPSCVSKVGAPPTDAQPGNKDVYFHINIDGKPILLFAEEGWGAVELNFLRNLSPGSLLFWTHPTDSDYTKILTVVSVTTHTVTWTVSDVTHTAKYVMVQVEESVDEPAGSTFDIFSNEVDTTQLLLDVAPKYQYYHRISSRVDSSFTGSTAPPKGTTEYDDLKDIRLVKPTVSKFQNIGYFKEGGSDSDRGSDEERCTRKFTVLPKTPAVGELREDVIFRSRMSGVISFYNSAINQSVLNTLSDFNFATLGLWGLWEPFHYFKKRDGTNIKVTDFTANGVNETMIKTLLHKWAIYDDPDNPPSEFPATGVAEIAVPHGVFKGIAVGGYEFQNIEIDFSKWDTGGLRLSDFNIAPWVLKLFYCNAVSIDFTVYLFKDRPTITTPALLSGGADFGLTSPTIAANYAPSVDNSYYVSATSSSYYTDDWNLWMTQEAPTLGPMGFQGGERVALYAKANKSAAVPTKPTLTYDSSTEITYSETAPFINNTNTTWHLSPPALSTDDVLYAMFYRVDHAAKRITAVSSAPIKENQGPEGPQGPRTVGNSLSRTLILAGTPTATQVLFDSSNKQFSLLATQQTLLDTYLNSLSAGEYIGLKTATKREWAEIESIGVTGGATKTYVITVKDATEFSIFAADEAVDVIFSLAESGFTPLIQFSDDKSVWNSNAGDGTKYIRFNSGNGWSIALPFVGDDIEFQFSADDSSWHDTPVPSTDKYIRFRNEGGTWPSNGFKFVGDDAPLVMIQGSTDGVTYVTVAPGNTYTYVRFSSDGGTTWSTGFKFGTLDVGELDEVLTGFEAPYFAFQSANNAEGQMVARNSEDTTILDDSQQETSKPSDVVSLTFNDRGEDRDPFDLNANPVDIDWTSIQVGCLLYLIPDSDGDNSGGQTAKLPYIITSKAQVTNGYKLGVRYISDEDPSIQTNVKGTTSWIVRMYKNASAPAALNLRGMGEIYNLVMSDGDNGAEIIAAANLVNDTNFVDSVQEATQPEPEYVVYSSWRGNGWQNSPIITQTNPTSDNPFVVSQFNQLQIRISLNKAASAYDEVVAVIKRYFKKFHVFRIAASDTQYLEAQVANTSVYETDRTVGSLTVRDFYINITDVQQVGSVMGTNTAVDLDLYGPFVGRDHVDTTIPASNPSDLNVPSTKAVSTALTGLQTNLKAVGPKTAQKSGTTVNNIVTAINLTGSNKWTAVDNISITPETANTKVKITALFRVQYNDSTGSVGAQARIRRGNTEIYSPGAQLIGRNGAIQHGQLVLIYIDSPASASSVTYNFDATKGDSSYRTVSVVRVESIILETIPDKLSLVNDAS